MIAWAVLRMQYWTALRVHGIAIEGGPGMGFMPIFASEAEARAAFPGAPVVQIVVGAPPPPVVGAA